MLSVRSFDELNQTNMELLHELAMGMATADTILSTLAPWDFETMLAREGGEETGPTWRKE